MVNGADERPDRGTVAARQRGAAPLTVFAAPATGDEFNTIGERLVPKGCFKVEDLLFDFGSSFIRPEMGPQLPRLAELRNEHKIPDPRGGGDLFPPLSIFGHADPVGDDTGNKQLSGRRATAFYAMLVRDVDLWEELFTTPVGSDTWGTRSIQAMVSTVQEPITVDGVAGNETQTAIKAFQTANGLPANGVAGPATRKALYRAYMDALCGPDLELDKQKDFLAQNKDGPGGKGDLQGCSEFNALMLFSQAEAAGFEAAPDKTTRNEENAPNRRVMVLLFAPGRRVNPATWPCPRVKEGIAGCQKRFFPDASVRRSFQSERRQFEDTKDTFACRFYQIISDDSPCERVNPVPRRHPSRSSAMLTRITSSMRMSPSLNSFVSESGIRPSTPLATSAMALRKRQISSDPISVASISGCVIRRRPRPPSISIGKRSRATKATTMRRRHRC